MTEIWYRITQRELNVVSNEWESLEMKQQKKEILDNITKSRQEQPQEQQPEGERK